MSVAITAMIGLAVMLETPVSPSLRSATNKQVGRVIPAQKLTDADGKPAQIGGKKSQPTLLYFIQTGCPCCKAAKPFADRFQTYYGDVADVYGVIDSSAGDARKWSETVAAQFRVIPDPKLKVIRSFGITNGTSMILLDKNGKVTDAFAGYSVETLTTLNRRITKLAGIEARSYLYRPAPKVETTGCPFNL